MNKTTHFLARAAMALLVALSGSVTGAWADEVEIGNPSSTSSSYLFPVNTYYKSSFVQQIYTADEIGMAGTITSISFEYLHTSSFSLPHIQVYMKNVSKETFGSNSDVVPVSETDKVWEGTFTGSGAGWVTIDLDTPFAYDGSNNLLVCFYDNTLDSELGSSFTFRTTYTTGYTSLNYYSDYNVPDLEDLASYSGGHYRYSSRANIILDITPPGIQPCSKPQLAFGDITPNSATINWSDGSGTYNVDYKKASDTDWTPALANSTLLTTTLTGLAASTDYQVRVQSVCSDGNSSYKMANFSTPCADITTFPWIMSFESCTESNVPKCWDNSGSTSTSSSSYIWSVFNYEGNKMLRMYNYMAKAGSALINTPAIVLPSYGCELSFLYCHTASCGDLTLKISLDGGATFANLASYAQTSNYSSAAHEYPTDFVEATVSLAAYAGKTVMLQFYAEPDYDKGSIFVDDIIIGRPITCQQPTDLTVTSLTTTTATLSWTNGSADQTQWQICLNNNEEHPTTVNSNPYTIEGLTPATTYTAKVRAYCSADEQSRWSSSVSFTTDCAAITTFPWTENFDTYTGYSSGYFNNLPICWNYINTATNSSYIGYPNIYKYSSYAHSGNNFLRFESYKSDPQPQYLILPEMENLSSKRIKLYARMGSNATNIAAATFKVGIISDPADAATFTEIATCTPSTSYSYELFTIPFNSYTGNGCYIAIMLPAANSNANTTSVFIDDITVDAPACLEPSNLEVTTAGLSATLTWSGTADKFEVARATDASANPAEHIIANNVTASTYAEDNLTIDTDYYFWVRAYCEGKGYSEWTGPVSAHIGYCKPNPTSRDGKGITKVVFGTGETVVNNADETNGLPAATPYYGDYASMTGAVNAGDEAIVEITYATGYTYGTIIWVDWNNNMSFEDNEIVYKGMSESAKPTTLSASFVVPANQTLGDYRMRIAGADSYFNSYVDGTSTEAPSACFTSSYAVCHDYTLRVLEGATVAMPTDLTVSNVAKHGATLSWTQSGSVTTWQIILDGDEANLINVSENPYTLSNLTAEKTYTAKVRAVKGNVNSAWSKGVSFTTLIAHQVPTNLTVTDITVATATIDWTENGDDTAWQLCLNGDEGQLIDVTQKPYTLDNLTPATNYTVKVRATNGNGEVGAWSRVLCFTTDCASIATLPWNEDFDSFTDATVPPCWDNSASTSQTLTDNPERLWGVYTYSGNKMLRMYNYFVKDGSALINTPMVDLPSKPCDLIFDYSHTATCGPFAVKISTDGGTTFTTLASYANGGLSTSYTNPGGFTEASVSLADYAGQSIILQFYADADYDQGAIFIDNVRISQSVFALNGTYVSFFDSDGSLTKLTEAARGQTVIVSLNPDNIPDDQYLTGEYETDKDVVITLNEVGDGTFTMPAHAVSVTAALANRGPLTIDLTSDDAQSITEDAYTALVRQDGYHASVRSQNPDESLQCLDIDLNGIMDVLITRNENEETGERSFSLKRLAGADLLTANCRFTVANYEYINNLAYNSILLKFNNNFTAQDMPAIDDSPLWDESYYNVSDYIVGWAKEGNTRNVRLGFRTLYKDGEWNTICLPFTVALAGSPLEGATAKTLTNATMTGTYVTLTFGNPDSETEPVTTLQAGTPYIIKWAKADGYDTADPITRDIQSPLFQNVTVVNSTEAERTITLAGDHVKFIGYYDAFDIATPANDDIYYMTAGSLLKHTAKFRTLKACRAYFQFSEAAAARNFVLDFGDGETQGIQEMEDGRMSIDYSDDAVYDLQGRHIDSSILNSQSSIHKKGLYIRNGHKVVIK